MFPVLNIVVFKWILLQSLIGCSLVGEEGRGGLKLSRQMEYYEFLARFVFEWLDYKEYMSKFRKRSLIHLLDKMGCKIEFKIVLHLMILFQDRTSSFKGWKRPWFKNFSRLPWQSKTKRFLKSCRILILAQICFPITKAANFPRTLLITGVLVCFSTFTTDTPLLLSRYDSILIWMLGGL